MTVKYYRCEEVKVVQLDDLSHCYLDVCRDHSSEKGERDMAEQNLATSSSRGLHILRLSVNEGCGLSSCGQSLMVRSACPSRGSPHLLDHLPQGLLEQLPGTYPGFSACGIAALPWRAGSLQSFGGDM